MYSYRFVRFALNIVRILLLARIEVAGRKNIPSAGPYIVVLNHNSVVDTPVLLLAFPVIRWRFFAVEKWRMHPIYGPIMTWLGAIFIKRGEADRQALKEAMIALEKGIVFGLAPEGTRSFNGQLLPAKDGAAYLASKSKAPILPVGIVNNDVLFSNVKRLRQTTLEVRIGEPFDLPEIGHRVKGPDLAAYTHLIMVKIAALLPDHYHGHYRDSPALEALLKKEDPWPICQQLILEEKSK